MRKHTTLDSTGSTTRHVAGHAHSHHSHPTPESSTPPLAREPPPRGPHTPELKAPGACTPRQRGPPYDCGPQSHARFVCHRPNRYGDGEPPPPRAACLGAAKESAPETGGAGGAQGTDLGISPPPAPAQAHASFKGDEELHVDRLIVSSMVKEVNASELQVRGGWLPSGGNLGRARALSLTLAAAPSGCRSECSCPTSPRRSPSPPASHCKGEQRGAARACLCTLVLCLRVDRSAGPFAAGAAA